MIKRLDLYLNTPALGVVHAAEVVLVEQDAALRQVRFRYQPDYLATAGAFAIDPVQLPLSGGEQVLDCHAAAPAFIDDYLPDGWGRRVLTRLALERDGRRLNTDSVIDTLSMLSQSRIGALCLVERGEDTPRFGHGFPIEALAVAESAAQGIDREDSHYAVDETGLRHLAEAGTGVGGARPKALVHDEHGHYLAKFNLARDDYNNAGIELACLRMARAAGIDVGEGRITPVNGREVLLLDRFDTTGTARHHLITANGLLKESATQRDLGQTFRYDNVCDLLRRHSICIEQDLRQLLRLMLFNRAINNIDDHERNFSLIHRGDGYQLAPGYDLVPNLAKEKCHASGYQHRPDPPRPSEALWQGSIFGVPKHDVADIAEQVITALKSWPAHAEAAGVEEAEARKVQDCFQP